jgi:hypothetical protein
MTPENFEAFTRDVKAGVGVRELAETYKLTMRDVRALCRVAGGTSKVSSHSFKTTHDLAERFTAAAREAGVSSNVWIEQAIEQRLASHDQAEEIKSLKQALLERMRADRPDGGAE